MSPRSAGPFRHLSSRDGATAPDRVELSVPADPAYLSVLRTATAGLAARADMTLDEIEDLRIAVDEACALVLGGAGPSRRTRTSPHLGDASRGASTATLDAVFEVQHHGMRVSVSGPSPDLPEPSSFAWSVLEALVDTLDTGVDGHGRRSITLRHGSRRSA